MLSVAKVPWMLGGSWLMPVLAASLAPLQHRELRLLDMAMAFLSSPEPWFRSSSSFPIEASEGGSSGNRTVAAVCGNWYDVVHKAAPLLRLASNLSKMELVLTGGRKERLTSAEAAAVGGEPMLLQRHLVSLGLPIERSVVWSGSRVTSHNLNAILLYVKQRHEFDRVRVHLIIVEEGFLVRREAATLAKTLEADPSAREAIDSIRFVPVGPRRFRGLMLAHQNRLDVALHLIAGEVRRLSQYSRAGVGSTALHGTRVHSKLLSAGALLGMPSPADLEQLFASHTELLRTGRLAFELGKPDQLQPVDWRMQPS